MIRRIFSRLFPPRRLGDDAAYRVAYMRLKQAQARGDTRAQHWAEKALRARMRILLQRAVA